MQIGPYSIECIVDARFGLDGGAMFGIVPRPLWEKSIPPDERNRIDLAARCLLVRGAGRCVLVETGLGDKFDDKRTDIFKVGRHQGGLVAQLEARGIAPEEVTDVVLTHLHFDHCGGTTRFEKDRTVLTFPAATHYVQRRQWEWARAPSGKDAGSFREEDFGALENDRRLSLVDGETELFAGFHVHVVDGHTPGMQLVSIRGDDAGMLFCADLVPTRAHLRWPYIMAYDNQPLRTLDEKRRWLSGAAERGDVVVFGHDPVIDAATLRRDADTVVIDREIELSRTLPS